MKEVKNALKHLALYYFLLALSIIPCANILPDSFPTRNVSTIYLLTLCVCLVLYYSHRVSGSGRLSLNMKLLSWMALLLILLRGIKYSAFAQGDVLARHTWYLYYVPMLLMPLLLFYISLLVSPKEAFRPPKGRYAVLAVTLVLLLLVLTNDLHQLVFRFAPGFEDWDNQYSHGFLFYVVIVWQYALYITGIIILIIKCRISSAKKHAWVILIPFITGMMLHVLLQTDTMPKLNGTKLIEFPEALIFMAATVLECCIQLGLIPTNTDYARLFEKFSIGAQITDRTGAPVYKASAAVPLSAEQVALADGARIGAHTVLHKMPLPGGYGFWQDDMTALDGLNEALAEAKENLAQEAELTRLSNALKEKETKVEQRTRMYDTIAARTWQQSQAISRLAAEARRSSDPAKKDAARKRITLRGAYIKRYANLMLLSEESGVIEAGELGLSVAEVLRYLNFCGIPGECINNAQGTVKAEAALAVFEAFETLLEGNEESLQGTFVNLSEQADQTVFKLTMEAAAQPLPAAAKQSLSAAGVSYESEKEDNVTYSSFTLPKGGDGA
ncbi:MAG: hypothetical protein IJI67_08225 [Clostridia bacterium]|nr:hypothetical protein [Clostridia bacterium]